MPSKLSNTVRWTLGFVILAAVIALAMLGQRISPPQQGPSGAQSNEPCKVDTLLAGLDAAAKQWCANGLFSRVSITGDKENVIAVAQFSPNGSQIWQIQSNGLLATFPGLTEQMAGAAGGRNVSVSVHDAADQRVAACARANTDKEAKCELKQAR
jgi:hypothetical protein